MSNDRENSKSNHQATLTQGNSNMLGLDNKSQHISPLKSDFKITNYLSQFRTNDRTGVEAYQNYNNAEVNQ